MISPTFIPAEIHDILQKHLLQHSLQISKKHIYTKYRASPKMLVKLNLKSIKVYWIEDYAEYLFCSPCRCALNLCNSFSNSFFILETTWKQRGRKKIKHANHTTIIYLSHVQLIWKIYLSRKNTQHWAQAIYALRVAKYLFIYSNR